MPTMHDTLNSANLADKSNPTQQVYECTVGQGMNTC